MEAVTVKSLGDYFADWEAHVFGFGYGTGEEYTIPAIKAFFGAVGRDDSPSGYDYKVLETAIGGLPAWLLINILCHADILEYGTSPRYGWLTPQGRELKKFVDSKSAEELGDLTVRDEDYAHCYPNTCNCGERGYEAGRKCGNPFWIER